MRHLAAAGACAALAFVWTSPLAAHLSSHLPGPGIGDNVAFLWNFWWMRMALGSPLEYLSTAYLFAPVGTDLTLHTHTALPALAGATVFGMLPLVVSHNVTLLTMLFLNGFVTYLLAWRLTRDRAAAVIAALMFGGSPYIAAHLNGHFNLTAAWTIPLFALVAPRAISGSWRWAVAAGTVFAATAYIDYYYLVYELALALCVTVLAARDWSIVLRGPSPRSRRLAIGAGALIVVVLALTATIVLTGGFRWEIGPIRVSARDVFNPLQILWGLIALFLWLRLRPVVTAVRRDGWQRGPAMRGAAIAAIAFGVLAAPIIWNGILLLLRGDYVTQQYTWRSAPRGIDIATLVLGNPFHGFLGDPVQRQYQLLGIDAIEASAWFGIAPLVLAAWAVRYRSRGVSPATATAVRHWIVIGVVFLIWALGPHLMAFGDNTGMILPQALLRYIPVVNNARIPGRAIVVPYLAVAVLAAMAVAEWRRQSRRGGVVAGLIAIIVVADYWPAPFPVAALDRPVLYDTLRDRPEEGAVVELPLGLRDGFGERGNFDERTLFYQTIHQRPLAGGFVARLPEAVGAYYEADPLLAALLRLSAGDSGDMPLPDVQLAGERLRENRIGFVVLNRESAPAALTEYVEAVLPLTLVSQDGARSLYLVRQP